LVIPERAFGVKGLLASFVAYVSPQSLGGFVLRVWWRYRLKKSVITVMVFEVLPAVLFSAAAPLSIPS